MIVVIVRAPQCLIRGIEVNICLYCIKPDITKGQALNKVLFGSRRLKHL